MSDITDNYYQDMLKTIDKAWLEAKNSKNWEHDFKQALESKNLEIKPVNVMSENILLACPAPMTSPSGEYTSFAGCGIMPKGVTV